MPERNQNVTSNLTLVGEIKRAYIPLATLKNKEVFGNSWSSQYSVLTIVIVTSYNLIRIIDQKVNVLSQQAQQL
jgi:hypothetical protein